MIIRKNKIIFMFIVLLIILLLKNNVFANEIKKGNYSKKYEEWLQLSDEEKEKTIAPLAFNVRSSKKTLVDRFRNLLKSSSIPSRYDLRDHIDVEVKNQEDTGQCWAFTANTSIETYLALHNKTYNFSERHIDYDTARNYLDGTNENALNRNVGEGGYGSTAFTYYARGSGPILEEDMPFVNDETPIKLYELPKNNTVQKIDNMFYFPTIFKHWNENHNLIYADGNGEEYSATEVNEIRNEIKIHIMQYGAISTSISSPISNFNTVFNSSNVIDENAWADHAVTIIGWDDNFSKDNFDFKPKNDGAYIVLNSWGTQWGDNGVYYVSYEDMLVETNLRGITSISEVEYDNLYQHDTSEVWNTIETKYAANVYECKENEKLTEVMVACLSNENCNIYLSYNDNLNINDSVLIAENIEVKPGYNTIKINKNINLLKGNKFAIIVELLKENSEGIGIEDNNDVYYGNAISNAGESYMSSDGITWEDIYDENNMRNFSIKAYTQTNDEYFRVSDIAGEGYEDFGGSYTFSINTSYKQRNQDITVNIYDLNGNEINNFEISGTKIKGNGTFVKFKCSNGLNEGTYKVEIHLSPFNTITKEYRVSKINNNQIIIQFADENFLKYMNTKTRDSFINKDSLKLIATQRNLDDVILLDDGYSKKINDISGIQYYSNIEKIVFNNNSITNISYLKNLDHLKVLDLSGNKIEDFSDISNLINLEELRIENCCKFTNIKFLKNLKKLKFLDMKLCGTKEKIDIKEIFDLTNLEHLDLSAWYWISENDLNNIYKLDRLNSLQLNGCNIGDLTFLENLQLRCLSIGNVQYFLDDGILSEKGTNHFTDLTPISEMYSLGELNLNDMEGIDSIDKLEKLENLTCLWLERGTLRDTSILDSEKFKNIKWDNLWFSNNTIEDTINKTNENVIEIELPTIIKQACNRDSILYSENGVQLSNCEWKEYGKSINLDATINDMCEIRVLSGYANGTVYKIIVNKEQNSLTISLPDKLIYNIGEELSLFGGGIYYANGTEIDFIPFSSEDVIITGYDKNKVGKQTITVTYRNKTATFDITVIGKTLESISILSEPNKINYIAGQDFNSTGMRINAIYNDGSSNEITNFTIINGKNLTLNQNSVIISYTENGITKTVEQLITVVKANIVFNNLEVFEKNNNYFIKISPILTIEELNSMMDKVLLSDKIPIYDNLTESGKLKTGSKIMLDGEEKYIVVVKGDTNGDGIADIKDMIRINNYRLYGTITNFEGIYQDAADVNKDGSIDIKDMIRINNYRLYGTEF